MNQPLILVTGSSGLIGRAVVERLAGIYDVVGLSRTPTEGAAGDFVELDVTSDDSVDQALATVRERHGREVASVVHLAAYFLHLADLIEAVERSIERRGDLPAELPVLLGERKAMSYDELQDEIGRLLYAVDNWPTLRIPKPLAKLGAWGQDLLGEPFIKPWMIEFADDHYEPDVDRACNTLGWEPQRSLRATLPRMIENFLADPERWYRENDLDPATLPEEWRKSAAPLE